MARPDNWRALVEKNGWGTAPARLKQRTKRRANCVEWTGPVTRNCGQIRVTVSYNVHFTINVQQLAWMLRYGRFVPDGSEVKRTCCNKRCVEHLSCVPAGTVASVCEMRKQQKAVRIFTPAEVRQIRRAHSRGETQTGLAEEWCVHYHTIRRLIHRDTYANVV